MHLALWVIFIIALFSLICAAVFLREYLRVTSKRREFIAALGGSGRAVPRYKHTLMSLYLGSTIAWSMCCIFYAFWVLR